MKKRLNRSIRNLILQNWPLRGLYWLSKDLFEEDFKDVTEPHARELAILRNHLEHKYVKGHPMGAPAPPLPDEKPDFYFDNFARSISRDDLEQKKLHLLKLTRSALIYLTLGMHREELRRHAEEKSKGLIVPMYIDPWPEKMKGWW